MRILAVETTATAASCCVTEDGRVCGRFAVNAGLTHSRTLLPSRKVTSTIYTPAVPAVWSVRLLVIRLLGDWLLAIGDWVMRRPVMS